MGVFNADKVIKEHISESDLCTYFVGFDLNDNGDSVYRLKDLVKLLISAIPEFALGFHKGTTTENSDMVSVLTDAAKSIYKIPEFKEVSKLYSSGSELDDTVANKYLKRGEFGELILHLLLREYHNTIPLLSKIYFKDSYGSTVHGFDAIHIQEATKSLWLGESKLYTVGKDGVSALIDDIKSHFKKDYMNDEFAIVSKKMNLFDKIPNKDYWVNLLESTTSLKEQLTSITIPLLCTYQSDNFTTFSDESLDEFIVEYEKEIRLLKEHFDRNNDHPLKSHLNIVLLLFPVQSKNELVKKLHIKLKTMQSLGD